MDINIDAATFRKILDVLMSVSDEVALSFEADGMKCKAMNPEKTAMVELSASKEIFKTYDTPGEVIGLDLKKADEHIRHFNPSNIMNIHTDKGKVTFRSEALKMSQALIDPLTLTVPKGPTLKHTGWAVVSSEEVVRALRAISVISRTVSFSLSPESFKVKATGQIPEETVEVELPRNTLKDVYCEGLTTSTYLTELILGFLGDERKFSELKVYLGTDYPIRIDTLMLNEKIKASFMVAPRISNSD